MGLLWHLSNQKTKENFIVDLPKIAFDSFNNGKEPTLNALKWPAILSFNKFWKIFQR